MSEATILLLIQYGLRYGVPAVLEIIKLMKTENPTLDQVQKAFDVAQTPFDQGLKDGVLKP